MKGLQPSQADILDPNNFAFMIVRHPLDRLISAFNDRILNHKTPQVVFKNFGLWTLQSFLGKEAFTKDTELHSRYKGPNKSHIQPISQLHCG